MSSFSREAPLDNYPQHLAPEFEEGGAPSTPFAEWWARVAASFPTVPGDVARYWLYEHWRHSPFSFLSSRNYDFHEVDWPVEEVCQIRSRWCDYEADGAVCRAHGESILHLQGYKTAAFMRDAGKPPARLVVLDNQDGHLVAGKGEVPSYEDMPAGYILIEGHRRFNMALALAAKGQLKALPIWMMRFREGTLAEGCLKKGQGR